MLQQTRVETVIPYYLLWMQTFPNIQSLGSSNEQKVLRLWEGLGYYSRARNIFRTARIIIHELDGKFPETVEELKKLPGIGMYIAGAIASIAFGLREPALDGNGGRVLSRLFNFNLPVYNQENFNTLKEILRDLLPKECPGGFNQAIMDLGSIVCLARKPDCSSCPLISECLAYQYGVQKELPIKQQRKKLPHYQLVAGIIQNCDTVLIDQRKYTDLLGGLWEYPGGKVEYGESLEEALIRELKEELDVFVSIKTKFGVYRHAYSHFKVTIHVFQVTINAGTPKPLESEKMEWVRISDLEKYPMGKIDRMISNDLVKIQVISY